ncbi:LOW QUALITY PROTEIN: nitrilase and fragile histidine triad fusion protein NitFhit-like [Paramacrobiotus metropolitanus]|uniref:LOW QUALITY PROTEIN: nitrilase and fragile histidine triad fusion protein NitFhit-like n=1 Tax=Paramacrobiotus metropolitanus TaxID=2943436 RepID=UPI002445E57C|nr:LOW QUALITY PROTEIN: nitrilase and fragile histidine triad fusion protein NitFhit-like [Paramacrobiotus metropolitanus]
MASLDVEKSCATGCKSSSDSSPSSVLAAVVQFTATADKERNLGICHALIRKAKHRGAEVVFLPECFDYLCANFAQSLELAESLTGPIITSYRELARSLQVWLSLGGFHLKDDKDQRIHNAHILIDANGELAASYRKTHLFIVDIPGQVTLDESRYCIPGTRILPPVNTPIGKTGLLCCYDLRFPEIAGILTRQEAEILVYPAAFTLTTGISHWEPLLKARAIENQCYVIAAAQCGSHNDKRHSYGHSMIVDPWGTVLAQCSDGPGVAVAEIDLDRLRTIRSSMPVQNHRRHDLYRLFPSPLPVESWSQEQYDFGGHIVLRDSVFYETTLSLAFVNLKPVVPGHVLVITKRRVEQFPQLKAEEVSDMFHVVQVVETMLQKHYTTSSCTVCVQDGVDAGQTVKHVHVHILPRKSGDFRDDGIYKEMEHHDKDQRKPRLQNEMTAEAAVYRKYFV